MIQLFRHKEMVNFPRIRHPEVLCEKPDLENFVHSQEIISDGDLIKASGQEEFLKRGSPLQLFTFEFSKHFQISKNKKPENKQK